MSTKSPSGMDRHVGTRLRMRRMLIGMSQEKLGDALGITFQQIQKYEKGTNRISASRLQDISHALGVPVDYFYEGGPQREVNAAAPQAGLPAPTYLADLMNSRESLELLKAFVEVKDTKVRRCLVDLVRALGRKDEESVGA